MKLLTASVRCRLEGNEQGPGQDIFRNIRGESRAGTEGTESGQGNDGENMALLLFLFWEMDQMQECRGPIVGDGADGVS